MFKKIKLSNKLLIDAANIYKNTKNIIYNGNALINVKNDIPHIHNLVTINKITKSPKNKTFFNTIISNKHMPVYHMFNRYSTESHNKKVKINIKRDEKSKNGNMIVKIEPNEFNVSKLAATEFMLASLILMYPVTSILVVLCVIAIIVGIVKILNFFERIYT